MEDINHAVDNMALENITGEFGRPGMNNNGEKLIELCAEKKLFLYIGEGSKWEKGT